VIRSRDSLQVDDEDTASRDIEKLYRSDYSKTNSSRVSQLMLCQFIKQIEDIDEEWVHENLSFLDEDDFHESQPIDSYLFN
jgi:hypothetical protein